MTESIPPTPQSLPEPKPVAQIISEWQAIEAKRPGGSMPQIEQALEPDRTQTVALNAGEQALLDMLTIIYQNNRQYHVEMGILIAALAAAQEREEALREALGTIGAGVEIARQQGGGNAHMDTIYRITCEAMGVQP